MPGVPRDRLLTTRGPSRVSTPAARRPGRGRLRRPGRACPCPSSGRRTSPAPSGDSPALKARTLAHRLCRCDGLGERRLHGLRSEDPRQRHRRAFQRCHRKAPTGRDDQGPGDRDPASTGQGQLADMVRGMTLTPGSASTSTTSGASWGSRPSSICSGPCSTGHRVM